MARTIAPKECMTVREIAEDLGCSVQTVYAYARSKGLPLRTKRGSERGYFATRKEFVQWKRQVFGTTADLIGAMPPDLPRCGSLIA